MRVSRGINICTKEAKILLTDVAEWLGYASIAEYLDACRDGPDLVMELIDERAEQYERENK